MNISEVIMDVLNGIDGKQCKRGDLIEKVRNKLANPDVTGGDIDYEINRLRTLGKLRIGQASALENGMQFDYYDDVISVSPDRPIPLPPNVKH
jgi:hypothetical protein